MDFDKGTSQEHRWLCMNCPDPVFRSDIVNTPFTNTSTVHMQYYWAGRVKRVMDEYPILGFLANALVPFCMTLALIFACVDELRPYAAVPLVLFLIAHFLQEYVPLTYLPNGTMNAITNSGNKYRGAGRLAFYILVGAVVLSLAMELLNQYLNDEDICFSNLTLRKDRVMKRFMSCVLMAVPLGYVFYLQVSESFTNKLSPLPPDGTTNGMSNVDAVSEFIRKDLPNTAEAYQMRKMWKSRDKLMAPNKSVTRILVQDADE